MGRGGQQSLFDLPVTSDETRVVGYTAPTVAQIAGITYRQLDYWTRTGLVAASITPAAGSGT
ncbi:MerR family transcriptional regulator, partial [Corynebacterium bovis]